MLYKTLSAAVYGIDANIIQVEVDCSGIKTDQDHFHTVGLPDAAVRESRDRVRAALKNCGYDIPPTHITINLPQPTSRKKARASICPWPGHRRRLRRAHQEGNSGLPVRGRIVAGRRGSRRSRERCPLPLRRGQERFRAWSCRS
jgi:hypothetical protein